MRSILLGLSPDNIPIITEVYYAVYGQCRFVVSKNIEVDDPPLPYIPEGFSIDIRMHHQLDHPPEAHYLFGLTYPYNKWPVFNFFKSHYQISEEKYIRLSHPSNIISDSAKISPGVFIEPGVVVASFSEIGFGVSIKRSASVGHHCKIGDFVNINPGVIINGKVQIGYGAIIGSGAIILNQVKVGANSMIGAGSLVNKDIPDGVIAYGNPCRVVRPNEKWAIQPI